MTSRTHIPHSFTKKKSQILSEIRNHDSTDYSDKSPKGTIDSEIIDLIDEINAFDGYVTTSSCAGRVAVFVEGRKATGPAPTTDVNDEGEAGGDSGTAEVETEDASGGPPPTSTSGTAKSRPTTTTAAAGPGGKGYGNRWLYVSHSPVPSSHLTSTNPTELSGLFQLVSSGRPSSSSTALPHPSPRLIKLSFSPLILHVLCANLHAAKGLLAAAINAGFRESGVQSLRALDDEESGVMVGIRTAGLGFETVVGWVDAAEEQQQEEEEEVYRGLVDEGYLSMCVGVVNGRFGWNGERRERLRAELGALRGAEEKEKERERGWEDKDVRRERKREEGLRRKEERRERVGVEGGEAGEEDVLQDGLLLDPA